MRVFIYGAGKVGRALARAIRRAKTPVKLHAARRGVPHRTIDADFFILAVRDRDLGPLAEHLSRGLIKKSAVCVHVAGALDAEVLAPLRSSCAGVAQMHPMISFASPEAPPTLSGGHVHVQGDDIAVRRARRLVRSIGMIPRTFDRLDTVGYHAAAGLVANGTAALAAIGAELLRRSGVPEDVARHMLGPLVRSVAENIGRLGFPEALTGPVRRGDPASIEKQLGVLRARFPEAMPLFLASAAAQLPLARALGEAKKNAFDQIADLLARPPSSA